MLTRYESSGRLIVLEEKLIMRLQVELSEKPTPKRAAGGSKTHSRGTKLVSPAL